MMKPNIYPVNNPNPHHHFILLPRVAVLERMAVAIAVSQKHQMLLQMVWKDWIELRHLRPPPHRVKRGPHFINPHRCHPQP